MALFPDYAALADLKTQLRIPADDVSDDATLSLAITAASRAIDKATNRQFGQVSGTQARDYSAAYDSETDRYVVSVDDLMTSGSMTVAADYAGDSTYSTTISGSNYRLGPVNAAANDRPWTSIIFINGAVPPLAADAVRVTATYGWTAVPDTIKLACLLQASRLVKRRDAPFGVAGSPDMGNELRLLAKLDPDVEVLVNDYRRWWSAA